VHDLHVWSLGSREPALTAHVVVTEASDATEVREALVAMLGTKFKIGHTTLQIEVAVECRAAADPERRVHA
jgi:cobalt-zinc-cadmium efflux system protein